MRSFLVISSLFFTYSVGMAQVLRQHQWEDRVILVFASDQEESLFQQQLQLLQTNEEELEDRELVVYRIFDQKAIGPMGKSLKPKRAAELRSRYAPDKKSFFFVLIGKDGGVKLRSDQVVEMDKLFGLIDSMPMRRAEMRRKG